MTESYKKTIRQIQDAARGENQIPKSQVENWLRDNDLDVLGAVTQHILRQSHRVNPPLSMEQICNSVEEYYRQCLIQDRQDDEYAPNRSVAGVELVGWFFTLWRDEAVPREYLIRLKQMLAQLCRENEVPENQLVGAVLEHLLVNREVSVFFEDWVTDSRLKNAYHDALKWASNHH